MNTESSNFKKLISFVVPVKNEQQNIFFFYESLLKYINPLAKNYDFEFIFTDNCSDDRTFELISGLSVFDKRVRAIRFSRDFGYQKSILTGYLHSRGDAVIQLDCDLQDPPDLILEFLTLWENGYKVVYGIRKSRQEFFISNIARKVFYRIVNFLSDDELPLDAGDFRLIDRKIINILRGLEDYQPYLRGTIATMGFRQIGINYSRRVRLYGKTKFSLKDQIYLALDAILNHSVVPLRIASFTGILLSLTSILAIIAYSLAKFFIGFNWPPGFTSIIILVLFSISLNAIFLGIIGEYIGRIYNQVKRKPQVIIDKYVNN
jgi:dolichol-phosphate mannosyltransferase